MKSKRKALALALCAVLLVVTSVLGTLAYLKDDDAVVNTFTVGKVYINLDEAKVNEKGEATDERTEEGNKYHLLPGHEYDKDPTTTVLANSEDCYVRMIATITYNADADAVFAKYDEDGDMSAWLDIDYEHWIVNGAPKTTKNEEANTITRAYEFRYVDVVEKATSDTELEALFTKLTVPGEVTNDEIAKLASMTINIEAHAIQAAGFADANAAWAAFAE